MGKTCKLGPYCFGTCTVLSVVLQEMVALNFLHLLQAFWGEHHVFITMEPQFFVPLKVTSFDLLNIILLLTYF